MCVFVTIWHDTKICTGKENKGQKVRHLCASEDIEHQSRGQKKKKTRIKTTTLISTYKIKGRGGDN
jgi:hypothetical protein